ncbi:MAG: hypothetical protein AAF501_08140, partial [Pseudomonadota bacterium]
IQKTKYQEEYWTYDNTAYPTDENYTTKRDMTKTFKKIIDRCKEEIPSARREMCRSLEPPAQNPRGACADEEHVPKLALDVAARERR